MPTYEYSCVSCGHELEAFQRMSDDPLTDCPACQNPALKRKIGLGAGIIFKGGGFYETDFKERKGKAESENAPKKDDSKPAAEKTEKPAEKTAASDK